MIPRYENERITQVWSDEAKLLRWDKVELAVLKARVTLGKLSPDVFAQISVALTQHPPNKRWWKNREKVLHHDLAAYVEERQRRIPRDLQFHFHEDLTSYDTEESAFVSALIECYGLVLAKLNNYRHVLHTNAKQYQHLPFIERTHGQWAKLRSFGGYLLTCIAELYVAEVGLLHARESLRYSRLAGAIGNYGGKLSPELEREALKELGFTPFYGSTQILPRILFVPLAQALANLARVLNKQGHDIRLRARSGKPLCREPFGKNQKGSSAMPHKKNTILTEQMEGMAAMAAEYCHTIEETIKTWEARAIEQSCIERVAWPDLFHVVLRMLTVMTRVYDGLMVYPDHMFEEIMEARGTYASDEAKNFLGEKFAERGLPATDAYRVVQLACFCVFEPGGYKKWMRKAKLDDLSMADRMLNEARRQPIEQTVSIQSFLPQAKLCIVDELDITEEQAERWNKHLSKIFSDKAVMAEWNRLFAPSFLLNSEECLFEELL